MKKIMRRAAAALTALLLLTGCAGTEGKYYTTRPHSEREGLETDVRAGGDITSYYTLKGALLNMINMGLNADVFRITSYNGDLEADLLAVIQEITTTEPMGIYGVSSITADRTRVLSYQDVSVQILYKRPPSEMQAVVNISGRYDLENRLNAMLRSFSGAAAYYITGGIGGRQELEQMIYAAWMRSGSRAVGLTRTNVEFFPEEVDNCIVEITADYAGIPEELRSMSSFILREAAAAAMGCRAEEKLDRLMFINDWLQENVEYDQSAQRVVNETMAGQPKTDIYSAFGVFDRHVGAQSGLVLAASVLCDALSLEHTVRTGVLGEDVYSWITLTIDGATYVYDVTAVQNGRTAWLYSLDAAKDIFIEW
ncbi:MAG: hypothetical protein E7423_09205 [Ruminococcaceae bacterium]|nr:hypothetical protein [Oscillospiraceae bacterium]